MTDEQLIKEAARRYPLPPGRKPGDGTPEGVAQAAFIAGHKWRSAHTPTDDELTWVTGFLLGCGVASERVEEYAEKLLAGFRRSSVQEPSGEPPLRSAWHATPAVTSRRQLTPCGNLVCTGCGVCGCPALGIPPQGEPYDAQVKAALIAYWGSEKNTHLMGSAEGMRAALRAAAEVRGER